MDLTELRYSLFIAGGFLVAAGSLLIIAGSVIGVITHYLGLH